MKITERNVPNYWLLGSCFRNAFSHLFSPSPHINSFSLMPIKCWAKCFRASLNSPASVHEWLQPPFPGFGSSRKDMLMCKHTPLHRAWWEQRQIPLQSVPNINNLKNMYILLIQPLIMTVKQLVCEAWKKEGFGYRDQIPDENVTRQLLVSELGGNQSEPIRFECGFFWIRYIKAV